MTASLRLASSNSSPKIGRARKPKPQAKPLVSREAREREALGLPFYVCRDINPHHIPQTYLSLTSYKPRVERRSWRWPAAVIVGGVFGLAVLGATQDAVTASLIGAVVGGGVWLMDGWRAR